MIDAPPITAKELFEALIPAPPDDTCRTCRFWKSHPDDKWGDCGGLEAQVRSLGVTPPYADDYGCIFHRPKEAG